MAGKILIVDDEKDMLVLLKRIISEKTPYEVTITDNPLQVPELLQKTEFDVVITDLKMPRQNGIKVLETVKQKRERTAVVIMTAYGAIDSAIEATRKGAFDYVTKPLRKERILHVIEQAMKWQRLEEENTYLRERLEEGPCSSSFIGASAIMKDLYNKIVRVANTSATVLITGESGTGKELAARAVHALSSRKDKAFIPVNCSALPESIIESELFGHLRGSFTGATRDAKGLVEEADKGTLFLDEIGDLNPAMQVKLLRLLQEGEYKVIGSNSIRRVDVRFIAATNQNLAEKIRKSEFREDLFYRLNVINIHLPPLRERTEDIPLLIQHFLRKYSALHGKGLKRISEEARNSLMNRTWPGNVRELENVVERGVIMAETDTLEPWDLESHGQLGGQPSSPPLPPSGDIFSMPFKEAKDRLLEEFQTQYIVKVLARHAGNVSQAARESGLKRQYLHRLMRETNVESKDFKKSDQAE